MKQIIESLIEINMQPTNYYIGRELQGGVKLYRIELEKTNEDLVIGDIYVGYDDNNNKIFEIPKSAVMVFYKFKAGKAVAE